ncbi:hypothetical protein [Curtobacterium sp. MCBD17_040]|uniref:hypothetical protein n=1 Tax=Curtobacterium sp. MCBD17_040 TaxID=2175674 RepID=UPI000DAAA109|nr:hypothetical protein [Curtobacterium sp. MCBD17_040]WIB65913.1 hypothetical protein DEI94_17510 [Curtobacterium sp. MCBD17_040]
MTTFTATNLLTFTVTVGADGDIGAEDIRKAVEQQLVTDTHLTVVEQEVTPALLPWQVVVGDQVVAAVQQVEDAAAVISDSRIVVPEDLRRASIRYVG